jgi:hypothetical protein
MIRAMTMIACAMLVGPGSPTHAASALLMGDGASVLIAPQDGQLQLWAPGEEKPRWKLSIGGIGRGARSRSLQSRYVPMATFFSLSASATYSPSRRRGGSSRDTSQFMNTCA